MLHTLNILGKSISSVNAIQTTNILNSTVTFINTEDATALPEHIYTGLTAYVNGSKIIGTMEEGYVTLLQYENGDLFIPYSVSIGSANISIFQNSQTVNSIIEGNYFSGNYVNNTVTKVSSCIFKYNSNITSIELQSCSYIGGSAFDYCSNLTNINLPNCIYIDDEAFIECISLSAINIPKCETIGEYAFAWCANLTSINLSKCKQLSEGAFQRTGLTKAYFSILSSIGNYCFDTCINLSEIKLYSNSVCYLGESAFLNTNNSLSIYVPASLVDSYKNATNWIQYSSRITAL